MWNKMAGEKVDWNNSKNRGSLALLSAGARRVFKAGPPDSEESKL